MNNPTAEIAAVLFDIGGVVIELNNFTTFLQGEGIEDTDAFSNKWLTCPAVRAFENGSIDADTFVTSVIDDLELNMTPEGFRDAFLRWPKGFFDGARDLIRETATHVTTGCLSNTNPIHWQSEWGDELKPGQLFDHQFLSFEIGLLKPDAAIYTHAISVVGMRAEQILFLDDNQLNVDAAREAGLQAERVYGVDQSRQVLQRFGVLGRTGS